MPAHMTPGSVREQLAACESELAAARSAGLAYWVGVYERKRDSLRAVLARLERLRDECLAFQAKVLGGQA